MADVRVQPISHAGFKEHKKRQGDAAGVQERRNPVNTAQWAFHRGWEDLPPRGPVVILASPDRQPARLEAGHSHLHSSGTRDGRWPTEMPPPSRQNGSLVTLQRLPHLLPTAGKPWTLLALCHLVGSVTQQSLPIQT